MKKSKILAALMAASMLIPSASAFAENNVLIPADGMSEIPYEEIVEMQEYDEMEYVYANYQNEISVMLDGEYIEFSAEKPVNVDGRVKLPFRELLETMGATVEYDDSTRQVSAERNGVKINFSLDSTTINIDDNGNTSVYEMDTSIDIINDRTFVPVRFMAEAFGLTVGWDEDFKTVVITDLDKYVSLINENCSNYMKLVELGSGMSENYSEQLKLSIEVDVENLFSETPEVSNLKADFTSVTEKDAEIIKSNNTLNLSSLNMLETDQQIDLNDVTFNFMLNGQTIYISTNIVEKMKEIKPDDKMVNIAAEVITADTWLAGDLEEVLVDVCEMDEETAAMFISLLTEPQTFEINMAAAFASYDENSAIMTQVTLQQLEMMAYMLGDEMFILTENEDGTYHYRYEFTKEDFMDLMFMTMSEYDVDISADEMLEYNEEFKKIEVNMLLEGNISEESMDCNVDMVLGIDSEELKLNWNFDMVETAEIGKVDFSELTFPEDTRKLSTIIRLIKTQLDD